LALLASFDRQIDVQDSQFVALVSAGPDGARAGDDGAVSRRAVAGPRIICARRGWGRKRDAREKNCECQKTLGCKRAPIFHDRLLPPPSRQGHRKS
jgi:hypothetical protein